MTVQVLSATEDDLAAVIKRSVYAGKKDEIKMVQLYFRRSIFVWAGFSDGVPVCIWGLIAPTILNDRAYLWLLVNDLVDKHQFTFVRHSQMEVKKMLKIYPRIVGHVVEREERSKRWLKWLGVRLGARHDGFIDFELRSA
jgi:hypothetical protein